MIQSVHFQQGILQAVKHIQAGACRFDTFSAAVQAEMGDEVKPFLRSLYEAARYYPGVDASTMSPVSELDGNPRAVARREVGEDRRVAYAKMSMSELRQALEDSDRRMRNNHLSGLPNKLAYKEAPKLAFQAFADIDGLKPVNDNLGHDAGDSLIRAMAEALANETDQVYHISGDEFYVQANSEAEIDRIMKAARETLMLRGFSYTLQDGTITTKKGIGFSYGTDTTIQAADAKLQHDKEQRKAQGLRSGARDADEHGNLKSDATTGASDGSNAFTPAKVFFDRQAPTTR